MRLRAILAVSLGLNVAVCAGLFLFQRPISRVLFTPEGSPPTAASISSAASVKTNVVVRRQYFTWKEVESTNYTAFIANLRAIECPEETIRDIIVAEVDGLFERRRAVELTGAEQEWWRSTPSAETIQEAIRQAAALAEERRVLLTELLGPTWEKENQTTIAGVNGTLDGPVLGLLAPEAKAQVRQIEEAAFEREKAFFEAQTAAGQTVQPGDLARLRQQTRAEMAKVLSPEQLEEYLLRYSDTAAEMRRQFAGFNVSPDEFRKIFQARDKVGQDAALFTTDNTAASVGRQVEYENRKDEAVREALGEDRYRMFRLNQDPLFRQAQASVQQLGAPPEAVLSVYQINQASVEETRRIQNDASLTAVERAAALADVAEQQRESLRKILGQSPLAGETSQPEVAPARN